MFVLDPPTESGVHLFAECPAFAQRRRDTIDCTRIKRYQSSVAQPRTTTIKPGIWIDLMRLMQERTLLLDDLTEKAKVFGGGNA